MNEENDNVVDVDFEPLTPDHFAQVMDRSWVVLQLFEKEVASTTAVERTLELKNAAERLMTDIYAFYSLAANVFNEKADLDDKLYGGRHECGRLTIYRTRCALPPDHGGPCANETAAEAACERNEDHPEWRAARDKK